MKYYDQLPAYKIQVNTKNTGDEVQTWRACIGQGGINSLPLTKSTISAISKLNLPKIRIFLQQYLDVLQLDGTYNWTKIDRYINSFHETGSSIVAAFCLKPPLLFPEIDERIIFPNDQTAWEKMVEDIARRYINIVTHWEIGNETDIGEVGGCPYLIFNDDQYNQFYKITAAALQHGNPKAKIGGSASSLALEGSQLPSLIEFCRKGHAPLDFISWHVYSDDPKVHVSIIHRYKKLLENWPGQKPESYVTEWSVSFPSETGSVVETANDPFRTASIFSSLCRYFDEGIDYSFYYHLCDNTFYHNEFRPFFNNLDIMDRDWNQFPHRFGIFSMDGKARPHYQLWCMLRSLSGSWLAIESENPDLHSIGCINGHTIQVMTANFNIHQTQPMIADICFINLDPGVYQIIVERIYGMENMSDDGLKLNPIEKREISTTGNWRCPIYLAPNAVAKVSINKINDASLFI